jgi:glutamate 5-kinase
VTQGSGATNGRRKLGRIKRIVVKLGSAVIAESGKLRPKVVADIAHDVTVLLHQGFEVVMVVSGAVAAGFEPLGFDGPPTQVVQRQAAASIGQPRLMAMFGAAFARNRLSVAQLLMTASDIEDRRRFLSARHTIQELLSHDVIPIINENDALSDDESKVGDNDHLAALLTSVVSAHLLVLFSRVPGVYRNGSPEDVIAEVEVDSPVDEHINSSITPTGVGGMAAKVSAARLASQWGVPTIIANGREPGLLSKLVAGEHFGTLFVPRENKLTSRKRWIAVRSRSRGTIQVDAGARSAMTERGASLLPSGIKAVQGDFPMGARVELQDEAGAIFAVGLVSYTADEIRRLRASNPAEYKEVLGYEYVKEIVHRDDMVLLEA